MTSLSRRPASAARGHSFRSQACADEPISYEDIIVAKYLDELRRPTPHTKNVGAAESPSPYSQKLSNSHVVPMHGNRSHRRPVSAMARPSSAVANGGGKPKIDPKFIADPNLWDPETPHDERRRRRPVSAPVYKRPPSGFGRSRPTSAKSVSFTKKVRSLYKQQPQTLVVTAFKNGSREQYARVTAPNLSMLLEECTDKLGLAKAARRLFLEDGMEVLRDEDITREVEVYVSTGEPFRNPIKDALETVSIAQKSQWTMNGIVWPTDARKKTRRTRMSKRFRNLIQQSLRRVLVFQNGSGTNAIELVADPKKMDEFLTVCTAKLELGTCGRIMYDWEGNEIKNLDEAPELDECLQHGSTPVLGPLWISRGEGFSPMGVKEFLTGLIAYTQKKLKEAKRYQKQLTYGENEDTKDKVEIVAILSMTDQEIEDALAHVEHDIDDYNNALNRLKEHLEKIKEAADEEKGKGSAYTMRHIKSLEASEKIMGKKGLRLKVYENGSAEDKTVIYFNMQQALRGIRADASQPEEHQKFLMQRLLDHCATSTFLSYPKKNPAIQPVPKKLFDKNGNMIKSIHELSNDQEVWLSFGEPWKNPYSFALGILFDKIRALNIDDSTQNRVKATREQLTEDDLSIRTKTDSKPKKLESLRSSCWEAYTGMPSDFEAVAAKNVEEKAAFLSLLETGEIDVDQSTFLRSTEKPKMLLFGELIVSDRNQKASKDWIGDSQLFTISKSGYICSKVAPQLVLGVWQQKLSAQLRHPVNGQTDVHVEGLLVSLQKKGANSAAQQWTFTPDGNIVSQERPDMYLTYLGSMEGDEDGQIANEEPGVPAGHKHYIAVCPRLEGKLAGAQRWSLKQERFDNIGQWKHTQVENPEWNKRALSWPVLPDGQLNDKYDWPMEGYLLVYAPPTKNLGGGEKGDDNTPLRLQVLKNGVSDDVKTIGVVAPPLKRSFAGEGAKSKSKSSRHHHGHGHSHKTNDNHEGSAVHVDTLLHCDDKVTVLNIQFNAFLDQCTLLLDLPFSARRLFDKNGVEHFNLSSLQRDDIVYVTCGEPWSDPKLSKTEQQRHFLLANLASDVTQIRHFVQLRNADGLVLAVDGEVGLRVGARLIINKSFVPERVERVETDQNNDDVNELVTIGMTSHDKSHKNTDGQNPKLQWPWEKLFNSGVDEEVECSEETQRSKRRQGVSLGEYTPAVLQRFIYDEGFIACEAERNLVLGVREQDVGHALAVCLVKRRTEDIYQRWNINNNGLIQAKYNSQMVLTAFMKNRSQVADPNMSDSYVGCPVTLQRVKKMQFGRANQRWHYNPSDKSILAFCTDSNDKEITAANVANVCTFAVMGDTEIDQTGYEVEIPADRSEEAKKIWTCVSCARAIRGRYKMRKLNESVDFSCAMGKAKDLRIQQIGSFRCLNGKVDLSTHEAEHTLSLWESRLQKLKQEMAVRTIAKNISAAQSPYSVKVLAYQNGLGRMRSPELIVGSSVQGILGQCSQRMNLSQAARRLYTADGTMILNIEDLIDWAREVYFKEEKKRLRREAAGGKKNDDSEKAPSDSEELTNNGEQSENVDTSGMALMQGTELVVGDEGPCDRSQLDTSTNCIIIPNIPPIQADGFLTSWGVFAKQPGTVALDVFRRGDSDINVFTLVGQTVFEVKDDGLGELLIDISSEPLPVQRGDVIGFHVVDNPVIPYDEDDTRMTELLFQSLDSGEARGYVVKMESNLELARVYSLRANIVVADKNKKDHADDVTPQSNSKKQPKIAVEPPSVDAVLHYPIEVFVSCGEAFVKPEKVEKDCKERRQRQSQVASVSYELYKEKHVLRHMRGRRFEEHSPARLCPTSDPIHPVAVEGGWQKPTAGETEKQSLIRHLQMELHKLKDSQKPKTVRMCNSMATRRLYTQPDMKRLIIFPNGEKIEMAQYVWGKSVAQILDNSTMRLNLQQPAKYLFTLDGKLVDDLREVERDQILCVSVHKKYIRPQESKHFVEVKANWVRCCRHKGHRASDVDAILFSPDPDRDDDAQATSRSLASNHVHSIELTSSGFSQCPTCNQRCITKSDVTESVELSAR